MNTDNTQLLENLLAVTPVVTVEYVKDPTPAEQTARLLAALPPVTPKTPVVTLESVESFLKRGGVATIAKPHNAFQSQKPQTIKKAKRTRSFRAFSPSY
jgi:hypothetical protein